MTYVYPITRIHIDVHLPTVLVDITIDYLVAKYPNNFIVGKKPILKNRFCRWWSSFKEVILYTESQYTPKMISIDNPTICEIISCGYIQYFMYMIKNVCNLNLDALSFASGKSGYIDFIFIMLDMKLCVRKQVLLGAICENHIDIVNFMLDIGVEITSEMYDRAFQHGRQEIMDILMSRNE